MIKITWKTRGWLNPGRGEGSRGSAKTSENFAEANEAHSSNPTPEEAGNSSDRGLTTGEATGPYTATGSQATRDG